MILWPRHCYTSIDITLKFTKNEKLEIFKRDSKAKYSQTRENSNI